MKSFYVILVCMGIELFSIFSPAFDFDAGFATKNLNLPDGIALASYTTRRRPVGQKQTRYAKYFRPSIGYLDPIRVKVSLMRFNQEKLALVSIDLIAVAPEMLEQLSLRLKDIGLDENHLFISAVHTHSGPAGYANFPFWEQYAADKYNPEIFNLITDQIEETIRLANSRLKPARIAIAYKNIDGVLINRRGSPTIDSELTVLRIDDIHGHGMGTIINYPIHGTVLSGSNFKLSSDVPGSIERHFESLTSLPALFLQGDEGDIAPDSLGQRDFAAVERLGTIIAENILPTWKSLKSKKPHQFRIASTLIQIGSPTLNYLGCLSIFVPFKMSGYFLQPFKALPSSVQLGGFRIDDHPFVFLPGEIIAELGLEIKRIGYQGGFKNTSLIGLTNTYLGYILNAQEYNRGGFESCLSFYGPNFGSKISLGAASILNLLQ